MTAESQETHRRVLTKLKSMRTHLADIGAIIEERYVKEYHAELQRLEDIGDDISEFRILQSDVQPVARAWDYSSSNRGEACYSEERYVARALMMPKLDAAISYIESLGATTEVDALVTVEHICKRFHQIARQLKTRYDSRETLVVNDEHDAQDLIHALLRMNFDDIRPEEWTPSYAGSSARMDFLLKDARLAVEVKKTSNSLRDRKIGEQLIVDIARYSEHPNCNTLVCFVYDPEGFVSNPIGLESDLQRLSTDKLNVRVYIYPK
jgi:hypothetical protein